MFNTIMESNVDGNFTFVELQTIKKSEFFDVYAQTVANCAIVREPSDQTQLNIESESNEDCKDFCEMGKIEDVVAYPTDDADDSCASNVVENVCKKKEVSKTKTDLKAGKVGKKVSSKRSFDKKTRTKFKNNNKKRSPSGKKSSAPKTKCEYPRLCPGCGHAYKTKQSFWNHKQRCPMLPQNMRNISTVDENGVPIAGAGATAANGGEFQRRKEYICAHCERHYRKKYNLREHLKNTCRGKPCSKGRLKCWEPSCSQAFYKYVDLVQHVTLQHGQDLQIQKLQFPNFSAFNSWKTEESNSKFMYARKITGSKRFSNTKYHYFVCQFNHRNEKKNNNRKTNRRKKDSLVVPNYNCPSRIMVKECENQILVTYISSHNHELNLSNVKYQPLDKEARAYIKTLLQLGVTPQKIMEHLQAGVGNAEIDSFLTTKQHFLTLNRIKRMESKLKAKNRTREVESHQGGGDDDDDEKSNAAAASAAAVAVTVTNGYDNNNVSSYMADESYAASEILVNAHESSASYSVVAINECDKSTYRKESDEVVRSIESNLRKLKGYMHKNNIKEKLSDRISKMIQELCDECENMENSGNECAPAPLRKPRVSCANRKRKLAAVPLSVPVPVPPPQQQPTEETITVAAVPAIAVPAKITATTTTATTTLPGHQQLHQSHILQANVMIHQQPSLQTHHHQQLQPPPPLQLDTALPIRITTAAVSSNTLISNDTTAAATTTTLLCNGKTFTPVINESTDLLKPIFQPFNVNLQFLKSIDRFIPDREQLLLKQIDDCFTVGWLYDAVVNSFLNLICRSVVNVLATDTGITEYVQMHHKVPDVWHCFNWNDIDTIFIPCNPSKKHWILMIVLVKQLEVQIFDPASCYEDAILNIYKKHETTIHCWYEVLRNFLGIAQWNVTSPPHTKNLDPANSGVLVCWYVLQYINKRSLIDNVDPDDTFRQFIFSTIVNNSSPV